MRMLIVDCKPLDHLHCVMFFARVVALSVSQSQQLRHHVTNELGEYVLFSRLMDAVDNIGCEIRLEKMCGCESAAFSVKADPWLFCEYVIRDICGECFCSRLLG